MSFPPPLEPSHDLYRLILEAVSDTVLLTDDLGHFTYVCPNAVRIFGYGEEQIRALEHIDRLLGEALFDPRELAQRGELSNLERWVQDCQGKRHLLLITVKSFDRQGPGRLYVCRDITGRQEEREALRMRAAQLEAAERLAGLASWGMDLISQEVYWSDECFRIRGYPPDAFRPTLARMMDHIHPGDRERVRRALDGASQGKLNELDLEYRVMRPTGEVRLVHARGEVRRDDQGRPVALYGSSRDITEQRRIEQDLRASQARLLAAERIARLGYWEMDLATLKEKWSDQTFRLLGFEPGQVVPDNKLVMEAIHPDDRERVVRVLQGVVAGRGRYDMEFRVIYPSGDVRLIHSRGELYHDETGAPVTMVGAAQDITELRRTERALDQAHKRLSFNVLNTPLALLEFDGQGRILQWAGRAERIFGWSADEVVGRHWLEFGLVFEADRERVAVAQRRVMERRDRQWTMINRNYRKDGQVIHCEWHASVLMDDQDQVVSMLALAQDITQRVMVERQIRHSRQSLRNLTARLQAVREDERALIAREIHDELGQALTGLKMDIAWLQKRLSGEEMCARAHSMRQLLDDTLQTVRRLASDLRPALLEDLGLEPAAQWYVRDFARRSGLVCECHVALSGLAPNRERDLAVFRILQESLTNVARHAQAQRVEVVLVVDEDHLHLEVSDDGRGIREKRATSSRSLGLIGMRERAGNLGGRVQVERNEQGGTTVSLRLPLGGGETVKRIGS